MVWGAASYSSRSQLVFIRDGMNAQLYVEKPKLLWADLKRPMSISFDGHADFMTSRESNVCGTMGRKLRNLANPPLIPKALEYKLQIAWETTWGTKRRLTSH
ncbi:hypothetical protein Trydic_g731 [Trypoxylus dichotomus]